MARLGDVLLAKGLVTQEALHAALLVQSVTGERLGTILVRNSAVRYADLLAVLAEEAPSALGAEQTAAVAVPAAEMRRHKLAVTAEHEDVVYVATAGSEDMARRLVATYYPGRKVHIAPISATALDAAVAKQATLQASGRSEAKADVSAVEKLLTAATLAKVSDIHMEPGAAAAMVYHRLDGARYPVAAVAPGEYNRLVAALKDRARMDVAETRTPQDGSLDLQVGQRVVSYRVATVPEGAGEKVVVRVLDPDAARPRLEDLGITRVSEWRRAVKNVSGLVLIVGATGSGKTTTLNATINSMNKHRLSIYAVEDPVEYRLPGVCQVSVNENVGLTFAKALRAFMRADPDVIMVGEIRDQETAEVSLHAAKTGHLVIATVHADTVPDAVARLADLGADVTDLSRQLRGVLVQRLVRTICGDVVKIGCAACHRPCKDGLAGRTIVSECVAFGSEAEVQRMRAGERWWPSMLEDAIGKANSGITTMAAVRETFGSAVEAYEMRQAAE